MHIADKLGIKLDQNDYMTIAIKHFYDKNYEITISNLKNAIEIKPDYITAYNNWGVTLGKMGMYEEAIQKYEKAIELKPNYAEVYISWGVALEKLGKYEESVEEFLPTLWGITGVQCIHSSVKSAARFSAFISVQESG